jgi:hypothetical protein
MRTGATPRDALVDGGRLTRAPRRPPGRVSTSMVAAMALSIVLLASPLAQSASAHSPVTLRAPYVGKPYLTTAINTEGCQVAATAWSPPAMNLSSGRATAGVRTHATSCPSATGRDGAQVVANFGLYTKSFTMASGPHTIVLHWMVTWTANVSAHPMPAVNFTPSAETYLTVLSSLYDTTNGTFLYPSNGWHVANVTFNGTTNYHHTTAVSIIFNQTLVSTHVYVLYSWLGATVLILVPDIGSNSASANLNVATLGNGAKLTSISRF